MTGFFKLYLKVVFASILQGSVFFMLATVSYTSSGAAGPRCPDWTTEDAPIITGTYKPSKNKSLGIGSPFAEKTYFWTKGVWFELPFGYRNPWVTKDIASAILDKERYKRFLLTLKSKGFDPETGKYNPELIIQGGAPSSFVFWMPSLRYLERNRLSVPHNRPCEAGRKAPTKNEYVVKFRIDWPFLVDSENSHQVHNFRLAAQRLANDGKLPLQDSERFEHTLNGPITGYKYYNIYYDNKDLVVQFLCSPFIGTDASRNPICHGRVWQRSADLVLYMSFPSDHGQVKNDKRWLEPVNAAISLANKWWK